MSVTKQVILYRRDLKMRKGKIAAQCAHASMKVLLNMASRPSPDTLVIKMTPPVASWVSGRFTKIVLSVADEDTLIAAHAEALARGLPCAMIVDSGKTEFHGQPTRTTVAIGPADSDAIDAVTGRDGVVETKLA
ncbi:MAG: aminoacyl-tRNA hydrolase [Myxococcota bacterium]